MDQLHKGWELLALQNSRQRRICSQSFTWLWRICSRTHWWLDFCISKCSIPPLANIVTMQQRRQSSIHIHSRDSHHKTVSRWHRLPNSSSILSLSPNFTSINRSRFSLLQPSQNPQPFPQMTCYSTLYLLSMDIRYTDHHSSFVLITNSSNKQMENIIKHIAIWMNSQTTLFYLFWILSNLCWSSVIFVI